MGRRLLCMLLLLSLLMACATTVLAGETPARFAGDSLTGNDRAIYDFLKDHIVRVANGEESLTVFELPLTELGLAGPWTAEDLGVPALVVDGGIPDNVVAAMQQKLAHNERWILEALICDYPYEMFWHDKTAGVLSGLQAGITVTYVGDVQKISFTPEAKMLFVLAVAQEYSGGSIYGESGLRCDVSSAALSSYQVQTAVVNAAQIVAANAHKSDYEKLLAYKQAICSAVAYNSSAAENDSTPYGNPWQLIYVFDGDSDTDVVCEGYAKAFKYLCDLSTFEGDVSCYLVSGVMASTNSGTENHMWNIVSMGNGQTYLVDVTNCDERTVGAPEWLFLAGNDLPAEEPGDYGVDVPPQDLGNGYTMGAKVVYVHDDLTKAMWSAAGILEISTSDYPVPSTGHSWDSKKPSNIKVSEANCTTPAMYKVQCDLCDAVSDSLTVAVGAVDPTVHSWDFGNVTTPATCLADGVKTYTCQNDANHTKTEPVPATGHTAGTPVEKNRVEPSCDVAGSYDSVVYCTVCHAEISRTPNVIPATGHSWDSGNVTTPATCLTDGVKTYTCQNDANHTKTEPVPATGNHADSDGNSKCDSCGTVLSHSCNLVEIDHHTENGQCTATFRCTICGRTETSSVQMSKEQLSISALPQELVQTVTVVIVSYENGRMTGIQMVERPVSDIAITVQGSELSSFFVDLNTLAPVMEYLTLTSN